MSSGGSPILPPSLVFAADTRMGDAAPAPDRLNQRHPQGRMQSHNLIVPTPLLTG